MKYRFWLFLLWMVFYSIGIILLFSFYFNGIILIEDLRPNFARLTGIYAPYLTPIVAFWFIKNVVAKNNQASSLHFKITFIVSLIFNSIVLLVILSVYTQDNGVDIVKNTFDSAAQIAGIMAFFLGPAIGFFFGVDSKNKEPI